MKTFNCPSCKNKSLETLEEVGGNSRLLFCVCCNSTFKKREKNHHINFTDKLLETDILYKQKRVKTSLNKTWFNIKNGNGCATVKRISIKDNICFKSNFVKITIKLNTVNHTHSGLLLIQGLDNAYILYSTPDLLEGEYEEFERMVIKYVDKSKSISILELENILNSSSFYVEVLDDTAIDTSDYDY